MIFQTHLEEYLTTEYKKNSPSILFSLDNYYMTELTPEACYNGKALIFPATKAM
jgi:hypothetical protein